MTDRRERTVGVVAICCRDGRVLLIRRAAGVSFGGRWCFPGGAIEPGESQQQALSRELREELGVRARAVRRLWTYDSPDGSLQLHWWYAELLDESLQPNAAEVAEVAWLSPDEALGLAGLLEADRAFLSDNLEALRQLCMGDCHEAACVGDVCNPGWQQRILSELRLLRARGLYRKMKLRRSAMGRVVDVDGRRLVNFASNDYLSLAGDARVAEAVKEAIAEYGWGAGGSRLICGNTELHERLERALAEFKGTESALVLPSGYMANLAAIRALAGPGDVVFLDKLNHASIIDAAQSSGAEVRVFPHRNYDKLERLLDRYAKARRRIIVTDTVFSMDGDFADLPRLVQAKEKYDAVLIVDEAHATGLLGPSGRGLAEMQGVEDRIDVSVGTLSKALGSVGGFVAGSALLIEWLVNSARSFIFTTAPPPAACAAALAALRIVRSEPWHRQRVLDLAERLRCGLRQAGVDCGGSQSQIVPAIFGPSEVAVGASEHLAERGFFAPAIRPPAVPKGTARLRLSVCACHTAEDVDRLAAAVGEYAARLRA